MLKNKLTNIFYIVFTFAFCLLTFQIVFTNFFFDYKWYIVLPVAAVWALLFFGIFKLVTRWERWLSANTAKALIAFFIVLSATQVVVYYFTATYPVKDFALVFTGAYNYTVTGEILDPYLDYFYKYPNNMPLTIILQFVFRIFNRLGVTNFFIVGAVLNAICIQTAYLFIFLNAKELAGKKIAFFSLAVLYLCLPLHTYISVFYTDTTSMLFPLAVIFFSIKVFRAEKRSHMIMYIVALGAFAGLGTKIKLSVIIAFIAVVIYFLLNKKFLKILACSISVLLSFGLVSFVIDGFMYRNILDEELAQELRTPFIGWIAMGLATDGSYNAGDIQYIWSQETQEEKQELAMFLLTERLKEKGVLGYIEFLNKKALRSFGSGGLDYENTTVLSPINQQSRAMILGSDGRYNDIYNHIIQGYHIVIMSFLALGGYISLRLRRHEFLPFHISAFGMFLFLLLWEAGTRYLLNYYAIFILGGIVCCVSMCKAVENDLGSKISADMLLPSAWSRRLKKRHNEENGA